MFARKFNSLGSNVCPRACRARNATLRPSSVPRMYASEGSPNGVCCRTSLTSLKPGMWYKPLPPMMPISACCKRAPEGREMTAELVIIQGERYKVRGMRLEVGGENLLVELLAEFLVSKAGGMGVLPPTSNLRPLTSPTSSPPRLQKSPAPRLSSSH